MKKSIVLSAFLTLAVTFGALAQEVKTEEKKRELEGDVLILYSKIDISKKINTFEIYNTLLTEIYSDQQNIVHTHINGNKKSLLMTNTESKEKIDY